MTITPDASCCARPTSGRRTSSSILEEDDEFHMAFHFPVMPRIYMSLAMGDRTPIVDILDATPAISQKQPMGHFFPQPRRAHPRDGNPEERDFMWDYYAPDPQCASTSAFAGDWRPCWAATA
jgi:hypothetical protein